LYNTFGNTTKITTAASGLESRYLTMTYDSKGRFVTKKTNAIGHSVDLTYEKYYGQVTSSTDANGNKVENKYDGFGRLKETINPTGQIISYLLGWTSGSSPTHSVYYAMTSTSGAGAAKEYFDCLGRTLRTETVGFNGTKIYTDTEYNSKGQVSKVSNPHYAGNSPVWTTNSYDSYFRLTTQYRPTATFTYSYSGKSTTTTNSSTGQSYSQTTDALGNIVSNTDAGGTVTYSYNNAGLVRQVSGVGATFTLEYDDYGNQTKLVDPNAGTITYQHNAFGEIISQSDARGNTYSMSYDKLGRMTSKSGPEGTSTYTYDTETNGKGLLTSFNGPGNMGYSYKYDQYGRIVQENEKIEGEVFSTKYVYDTYGNVSQMEYPSGFKINKTYNSYGYLQEIKRADNGHLIWKAEKANALMQVEQYLTGDNIRTYQTYDAYGIPSGVQSGSVLNWQYTFNTSSGNLSSRKDNIHNLTETFTYDNLNRLSGISKNGVSTATMQYANSGNITSKSDVGSFNYAENGAGVHALTSVDNPTKAIPSLQQNVSFTSFNKISSISEGEFELTIKYGPGQDRRKTELLRNDNVELTKIFATNYEKTISGSNTKELHYIWGGDGLAAIYVIDNGLGSMYYVYKDYLGSILALTNESGTVVSRNSFDAWGRPRNPSDWSYNNVPSSLLDRGFTGHEHLKEFNLINMNGRVYDPITGRFLSIDPYVHATDFTQGLNRYSYTLNNPLIYTDPSGEIPVWLVYMAAGAVTNLLSNAADGNINSWEDALVSAGIGAVQGLVGFGSGQMLNTVHGAIWGGLAGGLIGGVSSGIIGGFTAQYYGGNFEEGFKSGAIIGGITGAASGGYKGYMNAQAAGFNPWTGGMTSAQKAIWNDGLKDMRGKVAAFHPDAYNRAGNPDVIPADLSKDIIDPNTGEITGRAIGYGSTRVYDNSSGSLLGIYEASSRSGGIRSEILMDKSISGKQFIMTSLHELKHAELYMNGSMHKMFNMISTMSTPTHFTQAQTAKHVRAGLIIYSERWCYGIQYDSFGLNGHRVNDCYKALRNWYNYDYDLVKTLNSSFR
jgi:RHS repeat-associated protein